MIPAFGIGPYEFAYPLVLIGLILIPLLGVWYYFRLREKRFPTLSLSETSAFEGFSWKGTLRTYLPPILKLLSIACVIIALARPQLVDEQKEISGEGIEIMMVMDISGSMQANDFRPNRLEVSKELAKQFLDKRQFDRIGVVAFAGEAFTLCPPTTDYETIKSFISSLRDGIIQDGTAIGIGLATALSRLKDSDAESKIMILLTDGREQSRRYITPVDAAEMAKKLGVKVYTIGMAGNNAMQPLFGVLNISSGPNLDEALLNDIASTTGGQYFRATDNSALAQIYDTIDKLEKSEFDITILDRRSEAFRIFVLLAFIFLCVDFILKQTLLRSLP